MLVVIRGAGDLATGVALRLWRAAIQFVMTDIEQPTAIRRTVAFSQAIVHGAVKEEELLIDAPIGRNPTDRKKMSINEKNGKTESSNAIRYVF